ncbi:AAA family ATPase [Candidatus Azambacteria bacterium]|nr:AAA family ATPase [Candidatus Azambacteria bacterium]
MFLKRLEVQGFKSFAQKTVLDFERGVSAVVGPNGSGKSNIADALRFVLGEQGMKNIRAKKSEDLIFSGSGSRAKMNIAQATLYFDNTDRAFPVDFAEVSVSRKIFRDGENQYFINNAQVRLRDLAEFIAKAKLGLKGYTIINQGMGDYILNASPKDRKDIIDEALGLREFQIKKNEAASKLNQTQNNLEKTESIIRELTPHLRFLERQAEKLKEKERLEGDLAKLQKSFIASKFHSLKKESEGNSKKKEILQGEISTLEESLRRINSELAEEEKKVSGFFDEVERLEKELFKVESRKSELERELGKLEGAIGFQERRQASKPAPQFAPISIAYIKEKLSDIKNFLSEILSASSFEEAKKNADNLSKIFDKLSKDVEAGKVPIESSFEEKEDGEKEEVLKLKKEKEEVLALLNEVNKSFFEVKEKIKSLNLSNHKEKENIFNLRGEKSEKEHKLNSAQRDIREVVIQEERIKTELDILRKEKEALLSGEEMFSADEMSVLNMPDLANISRDIERIKIKLETVELIDISVVSEYEETKERVEFLKKEAGDLNAAIASLNSTILKLNSEIEEIFKKSFSSISKNFNKYFSILFNGGSARLEMVREEKGDEDVGEEKKESVLGVDVFVSLPRKKVESLSVLSGGERTLSSLALLFALVSTSPPPFLVLDEVDAPLDEANAGRFLKILDDLKDHTQFVIITHNRETMRKADILYGVAMQEDGVSKLLSLKFEDALN